MVLKRIRNGLLAVLASALAVTLLSFNPGSGQTVSITASDDPAVQQLRLATLGFLEKGQWSSADAATRQLLTRDPKDPLGLEVRRLLAEQGRIDRVRTEQRESAFRESAGKVAGFVAHDSWEEALAEAIRAGDLAPSKKDLARQGWFDTLIAHATTQAESRRERGEWLKATTTYSQMAALFEQENNKYRKEAKKTVRYARLEATYKEAKEVDKAVVNVDEGMMAAALEQVRRYYVRDPDFKKMSDNAVEGLMALAEVAALAKAMPALAPGEARDKFRRELEQLRGEVAKFDKMDLNDLAQIYIKAKRINRESVRLPEGVIIREFLDGAIDPLDQFSTMIWPVEKPEFDKSMRGEFSGVGIQISLESGELTVVSPLEDTPAYRAGIQAGDVIVAIDGESAQGITLDQAVQRITGQADTKVVLSVRRGARAKPFDVPLVREKITIKTVKGFRRDKEGHWDYLVDRDYGIGYVRITNFMPHTVEDLDAALDAMATQGVRGLIIDFRFNPGGLLEQAVDMSDLFLADGVIVSTEGRASPKIEKSAHSAGTKADLPLVVLVNEFSASAAEIVTGALRDHHRALIVGDRTFGKGSVQNVIPVGRETGAIGDPKNAPAYLKLTTAYYYLPSGRSLHRNEDSATWGVEPDVSVKVTRDELQDVIDLRRDSDVLHRPGEEPTTRPEHRSTTQPDRVKVDPQLQTGLMVMRAELLKKKM